MKYVHIPMYARNVLFSTQTERFLHYLRKIAKNDAVKDYIINRLRRHIVNYYPTTDKHTSYSKNKDPVWIEKALSRGEVIYNISFSPDERTKYKNYVLYLNTLPENQVSLVSVRELDKRIANFVKSLEQTQNNRSNSKTIHQYKNGYKWIQLTNFDSKTYEAHRMNNSLYDLQGDDDACVLVFSLRDNEDYPIIGVEIFNDVVIQILGKNDFPVDEDNISYVLDFLNNRYVPVCAVLSEAFLKNGFLYSDGKATLFKDFEGQFNGDIQLSFCKNPVKLPEGLTINGDLDLCESCLAVLPNQLIVKGKLNLANSCITSIPEDLSVHVLNLTNTGIMHLPQSLPNVKKVIIGKDSQILSLPNNFDLSNGSLEILQGSRITTLPLKMNIGNNLVISSNRITNLPRELTVGKYLYLDGSNIVISRLPTELKSKLR